MKVFVYFNLHKKCWSVKALEGKNKGKVIAHCETIILKDCQLKVSESGRQRVIREQKKYVHAGVVGLVVSMDKKVKDTDTLVTYNPYRFNSFVKKETMEPVFNANKAYMSAKKGEGAKVYIS